MKKQNEIVIFEQFRIKPSEEEKEEIKILKKKFKATPIKTTGVMIFLAATTFTFEYIYIKKTYSQLRTIFKSTIRDAAINDVGQRIRKKNKKAYEYKKKELEKLILEQESRIKKMWRLNLIKKVILLNLGIGILQ